MICAWNGTVHASKCKLIHAFCTVRYVTSRWHSNLCITAGTYYTIRVVHCAEMN